MPLGTGTKIFAGIAGTSAATGLGVSAMRHKKYKAKRDDAPKGSDLRRELNQKIYGPAVAGLVGAAAFGYNAHTIQQAYKTLHQAGFKGFRDFHQQYQRTQKSGGFSFGNDGWEEAFRHAYRQSGGGHSRAQSSAAGKSYKDIYKTWGVPKGASPEEVKNIYRSRAKQFHPDRNPGKDTNQQMRDLNAEAEELRRMGKMAALGFHKMAKFDYHDVEDHLGLYLDDKTEASVNRMIGQQKAKRWALRHPVASLGVGYAIAKENAVHEITKNLFRKHKKLQDKSLLARKIRMYENPAYYR